MRSKKRRPGLVNMNHVRQMRGGSCLMHGGASVPISRSKKREVLDTILTEKSLYCEGHGITLGCIVDGASLSFMPAADLYSLFGNALENAIEAVERLDDPERRSVGLTVKRAGDMVSVHVENYFDGKVEFGSEGLPLSRKGDSLNHGYGVRSMRMIVEAAGGSFTTRATGDVFHLDVLLPVP